MLSMSIFFSILHVTIFFLFHIIFVFKKIRHNKFERLFQNIKILGDKK